MRDIQKPMLTHHDSNQQRRQDTIRTNKAVEDLIADRGEICSVTTPSVASTEFSVTHNLGKKVEEYSIVYQELAGVLTASSPSKWTNRVAYFKYSLGADSIKIQVR